MPASRPITYRASCEVGNVPRATFLLPHHYAKKGWGVPRVPLRSTLVKAVRKSSSTDPTGLFAGLCPASRRKRPRCRAVAK